MLLYLLTEISQKEKTLEKILKNDKARLAKWQRAMTLDFMSSEESNAENVSDSDSEECFMIKKITWRSEKVEDFFKNKLDPTAANRKCRKCGSRGLKVNPHQGPLLCVTTRTAYGYFIELLFL